MKSDKDKSGTLEGVHQKTKTSSGGESAGNPSRWTEYDTDSDGFNKQEFITFLGSTAHIDTFLKRADKDRSGDISVGELSSFIDSILR